MKRTLKWVFGSLLFFVLGMIALIGVLLFVIDPNTFKPNIQKFAANYAMDANLNGNLSWQIYPNLALNLNQVDIKNAKTKQDILNVDRLALSVKLLPLLKLDVQVNGIDIQKPSIYFEIDKNGRSNLQDILDSFAKTTKEETPAKEPESKQENSELKIFVEKFNISDADIKYVNNSDRKNRQTAQIKDFNFSARDISLTDFFPLHMQGAVLAKLPLEVDLKFKLDTLVKAHLKTNKYALQEMVLDLQIAKPLYTKNALAFNFKGGANVDLNSNRTQVKLSSLIKGIEKDGLATNDINIGLELTGNLKTGSYDISKLNIKTGVKLPMQKTNTKNSFSLNIAPIKLNLTKKSAFIRQIQARFADADLKVEMLNIRNFSPLNVKGSAELNIAKLREFINSLEIKLPRMADEKNRLKFFNFKSDFTFAKDIAKLYKIKSSFDETNLIGALAYKLKNSAISGNLRIDGINADAYLPPKAKNTDEAKTAEEQKATGDEAVLPIETLRKLDVNFAIFIGDILLKNLTMKNLDFAIRAKSGLISMDKLNAKLYDGSFKSKLVVDARGEPVKISINENLSKLNLKPVLHDLNREEMVLGALSLVGGFNTQGNSTNSWKANLNGQGKLRVDNGEFVGTNVAKLVCAASATLAKKPNSKKDWGKNTKFTKLLADVNAKQGLINNKANISIPGLETTGKGYYSLTAKDFSYNLGLRLLQDADQKSCHVNNQIAKIRWPMSCKGSLAGEEIDWGCFIDVENLAKDIYKVYLQDEVKKVEKQVKKEVDKQIDDTKKQVDEAIKKETDKLKEEGKKALQDAFKGLF